MVARKTKRETDSLSGMMNKVSSSSRDILLAWLGAMSKALKQRGRTRDDWSKDFEALVAEGRKVEPRVRDAFENAFAGLKRQGGAWTDFKPIAGFDTDRLQHVFEERVALALKRLGLPTRGEIDALNRKIDALAGAEKPKAGTRRVGPATARKAPATAGTAKAAAPKAPRKRAARSAG